VLALQLPFLLDGEIAPHRVEPDRDPAKRMEWNLLMNRHPDRLGYTWIEFGRRTPAGEDEFLTLGGGLRAVQGRGVDDRWFFVSPLRVGRDFSLTTESRSPLSRERLEEAVGCAHVCRQPREYRRAVDNALFKLGPRKGPLIELLTRLRQPQLSRQLDEVALSHALSDALAPVPQTLIEDTAEAFRGLEADREDLAAVRGTEAAVQAFLNEYRHYIRSAARRRAEAVRAAHSAFELATQRVREATHEQEKGTQLFIPEMSWRKELRPLCRRQPWASRRPGRGHSNATSCPVPEQVTHAVRRSGPPKQMLVVSGSPVGTCASTSPSGEITVMPPLTSVATHTFPAPSTASESSS
jgi:hypothetical protein